MWSAKSQRPNKLYLYNPLSRSIFDIFFKMWQTFQECTQVSIRQFEIARYERNEWSDSLLPSILQMAEWEQQVTAESSAAVTSRHFEMMPTGFVHGPLNLGPSWASTFVQCWEKFGNPKASNNTTYLLMQSEEP